MAELLVIAGLALVCWIFRITFVLLVPADRLPIGVQHGLTYLAPAVLAGIAAVELTGMVDTADPVGSLLGVGAMGVVGWVAHRFRNLSLTVAVGVVVILAIDLLT